MEPNPAGLFKFDGEDWLLHKMAIEPIAPAAARAYARRHFLIYFLLAIAFLVLPGAVFGLNYLFEKGMIARWLAQAGIFLTLGAFFVFFIAILALLISRFRVLRHLGIVPIGASAQGVSQDASMLAKRHGRILEYGVADSGNFWRYSKPVPDFRIENRSGQFLVSPGLPPRLQSLLSRLPPDRRWDQLQIQGDSRGVQTFRPVDRAKYFIHDLWLLEEILKTLEK